MTHWLLSLHSRHDMPGYTGHKPHCVLNQTGPRGPLSKQYRALSLSGSLILHGDRWQSSSILRFRFQLLQYSSSYSLYNAALFQVIDSNLSTRLHSSSLFGGYLSCPASTWSTKQPSSKIYRLPVDKTISKKVKGTTKKCKDNKWSLNPSLPFAVID